MCKNYKLKEERDDKDTKEMTFRHVMKAMTR
jgi:hypothetical protein